MLVNSPHKIVGWVERSDTHRVTMMKWRYVRPSPQRGCRGQLPFTVKPAPRRWVLQAFDPSHGLIQSASLP
jgi:hypothetical protein